MMGDPTITPLSRALKLRHQADMVLAAPAALMIPAYVRDMLREVAAVLVEVAKEASAKGGGNGSA